MPRLSLPLAALLCTATALAAHQGVQNPGVQARMEAMGEIAEEVKKIAAMAREEEPFDPDLARASAARIAEQAAVMPALFEAPEDDPKSEALPAIWTAFDDFTAQAQALEQLALELAQGIAMPEDLGPAMQALGRSCGSCHKTYRE